MKNKEKNKDLISIIIISLSIIITFILYGLYEHSSLKSNKIIIEREIFIQKNQLLPDLNLGISHDSIVSLKKKQLMGGMNVIPNYEFQCCVYKEDTIYVSVHTIFEKDTIVCIGVRPLLSKFKSDRYHEKMEKEGFIKINSQKDKSYQTLVTKLGQAFNGKFTEFYGQPKNLSKDLFYWKYKQGFVFLKIDVFNAYVYIIDENNLDKCADILLLEKLKNISVK